MLVARPSAIVSVLGNCAGFAFGLEKIELVRERALLYHGAPVGLSVPVGVSCGRGIGSQTRSRAPLHALDAPSASSAGLSLFGRSGSWDACGMKVAPATSRWKKKPVWIHEALMERVDVLCRHGTLCLCFTTQISNAGTQATGLYVVS